jgi:UDP-N-acetylglucosamine 2-epimerase (non-hydrolysing)
MSVVGARPQFVKLGPVSRALRRHGVREVVVHTGQHHDVAMSQSFFEELTLPEPDTNLGLHAAGPLNQLAAMVPALGETVARYAPRLVIVFGDTTSTVAAALAASYAGVPVAHVEAGMRAFVPAMPEEIARVVTDRLARIWFTASRSAEENLQREGLGPSDFVGDVMYDVVREVARGLDGDSPPLARFGVQRGEYVLATVHRAQNTDEQERLARIMELLARLPLPVIFPVHPRTEQALRRHGLSDALARGRIRPTAPLSYLDTMALARGAQRVFTDSGGLQKEAFYLGTPCTTLREETEWVETVALGWNVLVGTDVERALSTLALPSPPPPPTAPYGDGTAGEAIARRIRRWLDETA